jgi:hypothetical protein
MKIFNYQNQDGNFIFKSKIFSKTAEEKEIRLPKCIVIDYEIKHSKSTKELLIKDSRNGDVLVCDVTDLSPNVLQELISDIQKSIRMNSFYLQKHFTPVS